MYDRDRLTPVTLAGEYPVSQFVVDSLTSDTQLLDDMRCFLLQYGRFHSIPLTGVDHGSGSLCVSFCHILNFFTIFCDNLDDRNIEFLCKLKVTVIMSRYTHDSTCTIISKYIVRKPDWKLLAVQRIDRISTCEHTGLLFILKTVYIGFHGSIKDIFLYSLSCLVCCKRFRKSMLRCKYHECCSVKSIRSCCIDGDLLISSFNREIYLCTVGFTDPVCLHLLNFFRPVQFVQVI